MRLFSGSIQYICIDVAMDVSDDGQKKIAQIIPALLYLALF